MPVELKVPKIGESIDSAQLGKCHKKAGDFVRRDEVLLEIESEKATVEISAPANGTVVQWLKGQGDTAKIDEVIGLFEPSEAPAAGSAPKPADAPKAEAAKPEAVKPFDATVRVMPSAARVLGELGISAQGVTATGPGGRVIKEDAIRHAQALSAAPAPTPQTAPVPAPAAQPAASPIFAGGGSRDEEVVPMSPMRRTIAQRLVQAQQTAALLTTFNEVDMQAVMDLRKVYKDVFQQKYGAKLGFMSFFVKAAVEALKLYPSVNGEIRGTNVVYRNYYDVGIAVGGGKGLVVPILRNAERMSFAEVESKIGEFGERAKTNKIGPNELQGGTFTISNGGVYGSLLSTPIVNPPQSAILGLHTIQDRPVAKDGQVVIRPMMYLALTYDHRIIDGREAVSFLKQIKSLIEDPSRILLEI